VAQVAPEMNTEQLRQQYSAEKIRETERNLQELNRLNDLRTQQQRELERSGYVEDDVEGEENEIEEQEAYEHEEVPSNTPEIPTDQQAPTSQESEEAQKEKSRSVSKEQEKHEDIQEKKPRSVSKEHEIQQEIQEEPEHVHKSDVEETLLGVEDESEDKNEQEEPKVIECTFEPRKQDKNKKPKNKKKDRSQKKSNDSPPPEPRAEEATGQDTMLENRLFDFDDPAPSSSTKSGNNKKGKQKRIEDYEAPSILEFSDPPPNKNDNNTHSSDAKRGNRRNRNKRPHAEDPKPKEDPQKLEEQKRIVEELSIPRPLSEELEDVVEELKPPEEEDSPKPTSSTQSGGKNKTRPNRRNRRLAD